MKKKKFAIEYIGFYGESFSRFFVDADNEEEAFQKLFEFLIERNYLFGNEVIHGFPGEILILKSGNIDEIFKIKRIYEVEL